MRTTPYKGYALYEPDASPDLTESGEYNTALMAVDADMHDEEQARIEADTALNIAIANEMAQRKAADDMINGRVDTETAERKDADTALDTAYKAADAELDTAYKAADAALDTAYKAADTALDTKFTGEINSVTQSLTEVSNGLTAEQKARADADTALGKRIDNATQSLNWDNIKYKPFSTIGSGLKVESNSLTVDTTATTAGITANTTWSELE